MSPCLSPVPCPSPAPGPLQETEIRAFRPVAEWRALLATQGFEDTFVTALQHDDPTEDIMLCFAKPRDPRGPQSLGAFKQGCTGLRALSPAEREGAIAAATGALREKLHRHSEDPPFRHAPRMPGMTPLSPPPLPLQARQQRLVLQGSALPMAPS